MANKKEIANIENEIKFSKAQIVSSGKFTFMERDILKALLENKQYTLSEAKEILDNFNNKEVK